jgi:arabinan endo-1,5-alpha-L-arabinosidase
VIIRRKGYYYLFVSFDFCCRGVNSTYNIRVGRSKRVTGPYLDRDNKDMMEDGGTLVISGGKRWRGPGHCAILRDTNGDKLVYHAYDADARGVSTLRIAPIVWDTADWPAVSATDSTDK